jgi:glycosyltransferase involved in cell wall biosynthesis
MSVGCTIVGSDTAPVQEVIKHHHNGLLVDFFKPEELASAVTTLLDDPALREKLGQAARKTAVEKYDLKTVCLPKALGFVDNIQH